MFVVQSHAEFIPEAKTLLHKCNFFFLSFFSSVVRFFQDYTEPGENQPSSQAPPRGDANPLHPAALATEDEKVVLPLGENVLTHNLGIPIVVVLTKVCMLCIWMTLYGVFLWRQLDVSQTLLEFI